VKKARAESRQVRGGKWAVEVVVTAGLLEARNGIRGKRRPRGMVGLGGRGGE